MTSYIEILTKMRVCARRCGDVDAGFFERTIAMLETGTLINTILILSKEHIADLQMHSTLTCLPAAVYCDEED